MAYHMEFPVDGPGADGHFKWLDGPSIPPIRTLNWRYKVRPEEVGSVARVDAGLSYSKRLSRADGLLDVECVGLIAVVSARFKALVEQFEPDVHFFKPVRIEMVSGEAFDGERYIFFVQQAVDFWLTRMSQTQWFYQSNDPDSADYWPPYLDGAQLRIHKYERNPKAAEPKLYVSAPAIAGLHIFTGWRGRLKGIFFSDEFYKAFKKEKMKALRATGYCTEVDVRWDEEENFGPALQWLRDHPPVNEYQEEVWYFEWLMPPSHTQYPPVFNVATTPTAPADSSATAS